jgi:hypothetical protein
MKPDSGTPVPMKSGNECPHEGMIKSLCFLYYEALKENMQDMALILQHAIERSEHIAFKKAPLSDEAKDTLRQFFIVQRFQRLNEKQKDLFVRAIERIQIYDA